MKKVTRKSILVTIGPGMASFQRDGKVIATARFRYRPNAWVLRMPGHMWAVTPDMPMWHVTGGQVKQSPVKAFKSWQACVDEIDNIILNEFHHHLDVMGERT